MAHAGFYDLLTGLSGALPTPEAGFSDLLSGPTGAVPPSPAPADVGFFDLLNGHVIPKELVSKSDLVPWIIMMLEDEDEEDIAIITALLELL